MSRKVLLPLAAAALLAMSAALPAHAQDDDWPMMGGGMMGMGCMMGWGDGPMQGRIEGRLAFLKAELKITDAQAAAWDKFAAAVRNTMEQRRAAMQTMMKGGLEGKSLIERVDIQESMLTARLDEIKQVKAALAELYAQLDDTQKKQADQTMFPMVGMGPGPGHMRRGGWWRWWDDE